MEPRGEADQRRRVSTSNSASRCLGMINSYCASKDHFPVAVLGFFFMNFSNSLRCNRGASPSRRLPTRLPSVFFPPQDHRLQRRWQNKGLDRQNSAVAVQNHPTTSPSQGKKNNPPTSTLHTHTHTLNTCIACILISKCAHRQLAANGPCRAAKQRSLLRKEKEMLHYDNSLIKNRIIHK